MKRDSLIGTKKEGEAPNNKKSNGALALGGALALKIVTAGTGTPEDQLPCS